MALDVGEVEPLWGTRAVMALIATVAWVAVTAIAWVYVAKEFSIRHEYDAERYATSAFLWGVLVGSGLLAVLVARTHRRSVRGRLVYGIVTGCAASTPWGVAQNSFGDPPTIGHLLRPKVLADVATLTLPHMLGVLLAILLASWLAAIVYRRRERARLLAEAASLP